MALVFNILIKMVQEKAYSLASASNQDRLPMQLKLTDGRYIPLEGQTVKLYNDGDCGTGVTQCWDGGTNIKVRRGDEVQSLPIHSSGRQYLAPDGSLVYICDVVLRE